MKVTEMLARKKPQTILATCCFCQKIRDGQGNWHERSEYRQDYQGVVFTHTFCPACALKHYAEFFQTTGLERPGAQ